MTFTEETSGKNSLLSNLFMHIGREETDLGQLGQALLDMSKAVIEGVGNTKDVDRLRGHWSRQTRNGQDLNGIIDADVEYFQNDVQKIAGLRQAHDSYVFYVPGGSGIIRIRLAIDPDGKQKSRFG